jgi:hypothetical protein
MKLTADSKWRKTLAWLRREHPIGKRVRVRQLDQKWQGECDFVNHCFEIKVKKQCLNLRMDTLLHEWAHALTWFGNDADPHGPEWGLMYAALYRSHLTWNYGRGLEDEE